jgi:hypothetical protein
MKIHLKKTAGPDLKELARDLPRRLHNVGTEVGRAISENMAEEVKKRLAGRGGWIKIYYDALIYLEGQEGNNWAVAGLSERDDLFEFPAENSLLTITGYPEGSAAATLANYQPWPIDVIPPLTKAYEGTAVLQMHDPGTVKTYREARLRNLPTVVDALNEVAQVDQSGDTLVEVERIYADIAYMARRLELGFDGYPRVPHWGPAASAASAKGDRWATSPDVMRLVESAVKGKEPGTVTTMSPAQAAELARIREATWS